MRAGPRVILDVPSLDLAPGLVGLRGPNGAGKTTLLRLVATLGRPDAGTVTIGGLDTRRDGPAARRVVGYAGHEPALAGPVRVADALRLHATTHGLDDAAVATALGACGIRPLADRVVRTLSRGERALADLARAILHRPTVLLLDEPFANLDDAHRSVVADVVRHAVRRGALVVVATHAELAVQPDLTLHLDDGRITRRVEPDDARGGP